MLKLRKNKKGFTLVELIVVIAIMAVLAGTVAGVTVTQLNKNTDKAAGTQAKTIADFISAEIMDGEDITVADYTIGTFKTSTADATGLALKLETQFGSEKVAATAVKGGAIGVSFDDANDIITVTYMGKQANNKGDVSYTITSEGVVTKA